MNEDKCQTQEEWISSLEKMSFDERCVAIKDKILESKEIEDKSKRYFSEAFNYVYDKYKKNKPLDTNLFKIHMTDICGYDTMKMDEFTRIMLMLNLCGFGFSGGNKS